MFVSYCVSFRQIFMAMCFLFLCCIEKETFSFPNGTSDSSLTLEVLRHFDISEKQYNEALQENKFLLSHTVTKFSNNMFRTLSTDHKSRNKNIIISPFSIHLALSMLYYGAQKPSDTRSEILNVLGPNVESEAFSKSAFYYLDLLQQYRRDNNKFDSQLSIATKMFVQEGLVVKAMFLAILKFYLTTSENVDFGKSQETASRINRFVELKTNGLINEIISPDNIDSLTRLVLVNAIYFKAGWKYKFNEQFTRPMQFILLDNSAIDHMHGMRVNANLRIGTSRRLNANILELPYSNPDYKMYILIPRINSLRALNRLAISFNMSEVESNLHMKNLELTMPAFQISFDIDLKQVLRSMGITSMFDPENANFTEMSNDELFVKDVFHRAHINVNEKGSEAAATTTVIQGTRSLPQDVSEFRVDRPFIYIIYDIRNRIPLFVGRMLNPSIV